MMDTDAIYSAVCAYGNAKCVGDTFDVYDSIEEIKSLLNEADEEHKSLLATNEKLVDEVAELRQENQRLAQAVKWESDLCQQALESRKELETENAELKAKLTDKASLLRGCYAADHKQKQRIEELTAELERIKANPVHQFRKSRCADWFDGNPDHTDGGGPYETRTLYALGSKT